MTYVLTLLLLLLPSLAWAQAGFLQAVPGTARPLCTSIPNPVTNETWCADASGFATDTYTWKVWNGTTYIPISGGGGGGGGAPGLPFGSTQFNNSGTFGGSTAPIYVKAFGTTRPAIQAAINAAPAGGSVQFECAVYTLDTTTLTITKSLALLGCSSSSVGFQAPWNSTAAAPTTGTVLAGGPSTTMFTVSYDSSISTGSQHGVLFRDININVGSFGTGILFQGAGAPPDGFPSRATGLTLERMALTGGNIGLKGTRVRGVTVNNSAFTNQAFRSIDLFGFNCDDGGINVFGSNFLGGAITGRTGTTHVGTPLITGMSSTVGLVPGMTLYGTGIPVTASILTVDSGSQVTMTENSTAGATVGLTVFASDAIYLEHMAAPVIQGNFSLYYKWPLHVNFGTTCTGPGPTEFEIYGNQFEANIPGGNCILIDAGTASGGAMQIVGNQMGKGGTAGDALKITALDGQLIFAITVTGNNMESTPGGFGCVNFTNVQNANVTGNVCYINDSNGFVYKQSGVDPYGNIVSGNTVVNPVDGMAGYPNVGMPSYTLLSYFNRDGGSITDLATLPAVLDGSAVWCQDCEVTNPCSSGGLGAMAYRRNGAWECAGAGITPAAVADTQIVVGDGLGITGFPDFTWNEPLSSLVAFSPLIRLGDVRGLTSLQSTGILDGTTNPVVFTHILGGTGVNITNDSGHVLIAEGDGDVTQSTGIILLGNDGASITTSADVVSLVSFDAVMTNALRGVALGSVNPVLTNVTASGIYNSTFATILTTGGFNVGNSAIIGGTLGVIDGAGASVSSNVIIGGLSGSITGANRAVSINGGVVTTDNTTAYANFLLSNGLAFAALGTPANGTMIYCTDCVQTNPCAGSGAGAFAYRVGGAWMCASTAGSGLTGTGAPNTMTKWTGAASLGNSGTTDDGSVIVSSLPVTTPATIDIKRFGAVGNGSADDTANIQLVINAAQTSGAEILCSPGDYKTSAALTITKPLKIRGTRGMSPSTTQGGCRIIASVNTQHVVSVSLATTNSFPLEGGQVVMEDFAIDSSVTKTAGAGIHVTSGVSGCSTVSLSRMFINNQFNGVDGDAQCATTITDSRIANFVNIGVLLANVNLPDGGIFTITNNYITSLVGSVLSAVKWTSGGGMYIANNTLAAGNGARILDLAFDRNMIAGTCFPGGGAVQGTSQITITGNEIESAAVDIGIGTTGTCGIARISVTGNVMTGGIGIQTSEVTPGTLSAIALTGNVMSSDTCFDLQGGASITVSGNNCGFNTAAFAVGVGATLVRIGENSVFANAGTTFNVASATTTVVGWYETAFADLAGAALQDGSRIWCADCDPTATLLTCTAVGAQTGAMAVRSAGGWKCMG